VYICVCPYILIHRLRLKIQIELKPGHFKREQKLSANEGYEDIRLSVTKKIGPN